MCIKEVLTIINVTVIFITTTTFNSVTHLDLNEEVFTIRRIVDTRENLVSVMWTLHVTRVHARRSGVTFYLRHIKALKKSNQQ